MRILLLTLLVLNLGYLGYNLWDAQRDPPATAAPEEVSGVPTLRLVDEPEDAASPAEAADGGAVGDAVEQVVAAAEQRTDRGGTESEVNGGPQCLVIGPVGNARISDRFAIEAEAQGLRVESRWEKETEMPRYWVHLPPASDMGTARRTVTALQEAGETDVQLISSGQMARGISLGLFSSRGAAERRQQAIAERGFEAATNEVAVQANGYWLAVRRGDGRTVSSAVADTLKRAAGEPEVAAENRPCDELERG